MPSAYVKAGVKRGQERCRRRGGVLCNRVPVRDLTLLANNMLRPQHVHGHCRHDGVGWQLHGGRRRSHFCANARRDQPGEQHERCQDRSHGKAAPDERGPPRRLCKGPSRGSRRGTRSEMNVVHVTNPGSARPSKPCNALCRRKFGGVLWDGAASSLRADFGESARSFK
jgi:hypothetical protein